MRYGSSFIFFQTGIQLPQHHLFKCPSLPQLRCHIYDILCLHLYLDDFNCTVNDFNSMPLVYVFLGEPAACCFNYRSFLGCSHAWQGQSPLVDFTFQCFPGYSSWLFSHINFNINLYNFIFFKCWYLYWDFMKFINELGRMETKSKSCPSRRGRLPMCSSHLLWFSREC